MEYTLMISTWDDGTGRRTEYAKRVVDTLIVKLSPRPHETIAADDGSPMKHQIELRCRVVSGEHVGIGGSLNRTLREITTPAIMYTTDDWLLTDWLNVHQALQLIEKGYDFVRLGPIHPNLLCRTRFNVELGWWLDIDAANGGFAFATRPFVASRKLFDAIGPFKEGVDAYETEHDYSERVCDYSIRKRPILCAQIGHISLSGPWEHIGEYEVGDRPVQAVPS